jgi:hypothetical protein
MAAIHVKVQQKVELEQAIDATLAKAAERYGIEAPKLPRVSGLTELDIRLAITQAYLELIRFTVSLVEAATAKPTKRK